MSATQVAQLTGVAWAQSLLANERVMHALCLAEFSAFDKNDDGDLDRDEVPIKGSNPLAIGSACRRRY
jgi:hypothetical protein